MVLPNFLLKDCYCIQDVLLERSSFLSLFLLYMNAYMNTYKSMHTVVSWWSRSHCSSRIVRAAVLGIRAQPTQWGFFSGYLFPCPRCGKSKTTCCFGASWSFCSLHCEHGAPCQIIREAGSTEVTGYCLSPSLKIHLTEHFLINTSCVIIS